jgi:hypothetical protein
MVTLWTQIMDIPLSPEQAQLLPEYQEKWRQIALSTEPIDLAQATEAVKNAYRVNGFKEPQIYLYASPFAGMTKVVELSNESENLGEGLYWRSENQGILLQYGDFPGADPKLLSEHREQIRQPLDNISKLFRPLEQHLRDSHPYRPLGLFNNHISTGALAADYCHWEFGLSVLNWAHNSEQWETTTTLLESCGWVMPFEKVCVICDRPSKILVDDLQRLHAIGEPAITFRDGYSIYVHHGVLLDNERKVLTLENYAKTRKPQLRQAIVEQIPVDQLPIGWLLAEPNWAVFEVLLAKLGNQRISPTLAVESIGLSDELLIRDVGPMLWLLHSVTENRDDPHIQQAIDATRSANGTALETLNALRARLQADALGRIMIWLESNAPSSAAAFAPGLHPEELHSKLEALPFKLPQEVHDLYCWHDGTDQDSYHCLFDNQSFMPLEVAIECAGYLNDVDFGADRPQNGDPTYLFPIFNLEKDCYAVAGNVNITATSPVYQVSDGFDISLAFNSLTGMLLTIAAAYEAGAYTVDNEGDVELSDDELFREISHKYNCKPTGNLF